MTVTVTEIQRGRLYALSAMVGLDGRISWVSPSAQGVDPSTVYLLLDPPRAVLIDTGLAIHRLPLVDKLKTLIAGRVTELTVVLTRPEPDCLGGLLAILDEFPVVSIASPLAGISPVPFVTHNFIRYSDIPFRRLIAGDVLTLGPGLKLHVLEPALRILLTAWLHDETAGCLFTSDFDYMQLPCGSESPVVDQLTPIPSAYGAFTSLSAKFDWLPEARRDELLSQLRRTFDDRVIDTIAPGHGAIVQGRDQVNAHYHLLLEALATESERSA